MASFTPLCTLRRLAPPLPLRRTYKFHKSCSVLAHTYSPAGLPPPSAALSRVQGGKFVYCIFGYQSEKFWSVPTTEKFSKSRPPPKIFMPGSHVRITVSPQPYDFIPHTVYRCDPLRWSNNFLYYHHTYKHSYKKLYGRVTTHGHDFQFQCLANISHVVHIHEGGAHVRELLRPNLILSYRIFASHPYQKLLRGL